VARPRCSRRRRSSDVFGRHNIIICIVFVFWRPAAARWRNGARARAPVRRRRPCPPARCRDLCAGAPLARAPCSLRRVRTFIGIRIWVVLLRRSYGIVCVKRKNYKKRNDNNTPEIRTVECVSVTVIYLPPRYGYDSRSCQYRCYYGIIPVDGGAEEFGRPAHSTGNILLSLYATQ